MKLFLTLILLICSISIQAQDEKQSAFEKSVLFRALRINIETDVLQSMILTDSLGKHDYLLGNSFAAGLEYSFNNREMFNYGVGAIYQFPGSIEGSKGEVSFVPVYAFIDYPLKESETFPINLAVRFGYVFLSGKDGIDKVNGGIYHSFGLMFGITQRLSMKIMASDNYGKIKIASNDYSMRKENLSISLSLKL